MKINKVKKLIPNLGDKEKYVLHYENLEQYESLGLEIKKIHRGIRFQESQWLEKYIALNSNEDFCVLAQPFALYLMIDICALAHA